MKPLTPDQVLNALQVPYSFLRRALPVPAELRASWVVPLVPAMLKNCCRGGRSSILRLHVLNWAARSDENEEVLRGAIDGHVPPSSVLVRFDPVLNRGVDLARGFGLVTVTGGDRVEITLRGEQTVEELETHETMALLLGRLRRIGKTLTETKTSELLRWYAQ
jgi:hypothetical protein